MKKVLTALLWVIAMLFFGNQTSADMYKWVDQHGVTHYSDAPSTLGQPAETIEAPDYPTPSPKSDLAPAKVDIVPVPQKDIHKKVSTQKGSKKNAANQVEIYTTDWCRYCKYAVAFLKSNRIKFTQYDIEKDSQAAAKMRAAGGTGGVPFAVINGEKVYGYSAKRYKQVLGLR